MKPKYLGDCLDFYKRWFLAEFFPRERLAAIPMLTERWTSSNGPAIYSALVGVEIIQEEIVPDQADRTEYFRTATQGQFASRDLFFDPDTGLRVGRRPSRKRFDEYLFAHELRDTLLPQGSTRVAVVYDQSMARGSEVESAEQKVQALLGMDLFAFAYCAQVAMVVVSRDSGRIAQLHQAAVKLAHLPQERIVSNTGEGQKRDRLV